VTGTVADVPGARWAPRTAAGAGDDLWPRTTRLLPWALAGLLVLLWTVPTEAVQLAVPSPVDPRPDRFALIAIVGLWFVSLTVMRPAIQRPPARLLVTAIGLFIAVAFASVVLRGGSLERLGELDLAVKKLFVLLSYSLLFLVVATSLRPGELRPFGLLMVGLAALAGLELLHEFRTRDNSYYNLAQSLWGHIANVAPPPSNPAFERIDSVGPSNHGLAIVTMLAFALPYALLELWRARRRSRRIVFGLAVFLIVAGGIATQRKTAIVAPAAAVLLIVAYRPRLLRWVVPGAVLMLPVVHVAAPAALGSIGSSLQNLLGSGSSQSRTSDYGSVLPDLLTHPVVGRGFGTIDPSRFDTYRILDNEYLGEAIMVGAVGVIAYLLVVVAALVVAHPVIRNRRSELSGPMLAAAAGCAAYGIGSGLFDVLSFPQVPYLLFFTAGMISVGAVSARAGAAPSGRRT
jgi:hypothetical protein